MQELYDDESKNILVVVDDGRRVTMSARPRSLPALDDDNRAFWTGGAEDQLMIYRCGECGCHVHPPLPRCLRCGEANVAPAPVSGKGRVASFTVNHQAWLPDMKLPFIFGVVELVEQDELFVFTNFVDCDADAISIGMPVEVVFEKHDDVWLPMFRPDGRA